MRKFVVTIDDPVYTLIFRVSPINGNMPYTDYQDKQLCRLCGDGWKVVMYSASVANSIVHVRFDAAPTAEIVETARKAVGDAIAAAVEASEG